MEELASLLCSFGLTKTLNFVRPFLAMAELASLLCSFGLAKTLNFVRPFLAMAEQASLLCSFGLAKTLDCSLNACLSQRKSRQKNHILQHFRQANAQHSVSRKTTCYTIRHASQCRSPHFEMKI
jgi:hypothetical protein